MGKFTLGQKAGRVLRFLMGVRTPRVASVLAAYGFTEQELNEGWEHLRALSGKRLAVRQPAPPDPDIIRRLDEFENVWFPIAQVTLQRHHPEVAQWLFLNLSQTQGLEVAVSVGTFMERLRQLPEQPLPGAVAARELLAQRGLTAPLVAEIEALLARLPALQRADVPLGPTPEERQAAEDAMWAWYLEWSQIARVAIHDGRLLRQLGFSKRPRAASAPDEEALEEEAADEEDELALAAPMAGLGSVPATVAPRPI